MGKPVIGRAVERGCVHSVSSGNHDVPPLNKDHAHSMRYDRRSISKTSPPPLRYHQCISQGSEVIPPYTLSLKSCLLATHPPGPPYAPQRGPPGDEGFVSAPSDSRHLFSPQESLPMVFPAQPYTPPPEVGVAKGVEPSKPAEKKPPRKLPKAKTDTTVSGRVCVCVCLHLCDVCYCAIGQPTPLCGWP